MQFRQFQIEAPEHLAAAMGWSGDQLISREITGASGRPISIQNAHLDGESAIVFSHFEGQATREELDAVSLYGYHASSHWGMVADSAGIHVLSARWLRDERWYRLPPINGSTFAREGRLLDAFFPEAVRQGEPARRLLDYERPTAFLKPVDEALVERLDAWREKAVRYSRGTVSRIDAQLQTLYAQLFVLRTVEDRGLDRSMPSVLDTATSPDSFDRDLWTQIFCRAQRHIGSDLFADDAAEAIEPFILSGVIRDLYFPARVPGRDVRYDFSWISADVLGSAYEKYLSTVMQPAPLPAQSELFAQPQRGVERLSIRKSAGAYYTPRFLTTYLATTCLNRAFEHQQEGTIPRVIDFACGSGSFLVAAVDQLLIHLKRQNPNRAWGREIVEGGHIVGIDVDAKAVTAARLHLWQRLIEEPDALPLPNLSQFVRQADGLNSETWGDLQGEYDVVLGNPPFLATTLVTNREQLEATYATARGRYDFSSLFVERAIQILNPEGVLGLVIPNRLFINKSAEPLRHVLTSQCHMDVIVDFGSTKLFDADAYVGCIVARKTEDQRSHLPVRAITVRSLDADFMTSELLEAEAGDVGNHESQLVSYDARHPGARPWQLLSVREQRVRVLLDDASIRLGDIATVKQGIRTGANDIFVLEVLEDDGSSLARVTNGLGEQWFIETDLLEPVVFGSELARFTEVNPVRRLLYPYRGNRAISELELRERYPRTQEYLWAYRDILAARSSLSGTGAEHYQLIRPRDEKWLRRPKLLIRDLAPATAFAADVAGTTFLVGGTAVVPADPDLTLPLLAYLNSPVISRFAEQQAPTFRGDFFKFEPGVLSSLPVLTAVLDNPDVIQELADLARQRLDLGDTGEIAEPVGMEIDALIISTAQAAGIDLII
ncbi:Eco57I restriction-modification methylase domain-containing protein [Sphingomonas dokdonensis]|uniref:site-specific DNA-methyltransferase (adenine-specific) n=1 Tax=Sphingomonas dokdonensis TaxID=344880 RepID=A0A245ZDN9_9SPHN|nr:N-6 DNA methylase [Sphingomonas dokdonensis]OWK27885.1 type IIS restriction enzyme Eco57I [Sphingomonas dokdonensis]